MRDPKGPVKPYKSPQEISKQHKVSLATILKQVKMGTKVEGEHTTSKSGARITALQHVDELPNYYTKLKKIEKSIKKEEHEMVSLVSNQQRYCPKCKKCETESECQYGREYWRMYSIPASLAPKKFNIATVHPANMPEEKMHEDHVAIAMGKMLDDEGSMIMSQLDQIEMAVEKLRKLVKDPQMQVPAWVQSKITIATDYIDTASDYMSSKDEEYIGEKRGLWDNIHARRKAGKPPKKPGEKGYPKTLDIDEGLKQARKNVGASKCWPGKVAKGTKMKGGKEVPNCVPAEDTCQSFSQFMQIAEASPAWQRKEGKNPEGGLNKKGIASYRREHPGSKLSLAVTTKPSKLDPDSKAAKRRKSFCARMGGMPGPMKDEKGRPTRKALSLKKWNC